LCKIRGIDFSDEAFSSDHFKDFNLIHNEVILASQGLLRINSCIVRVRISQIRVIVGGGLERVVHLEIATATENRTTIRAVIYRFPFWPLLENLGRPIVRILDRENKALETRIRRIAALSTPGKWRVTPKNTFVLAQNERESITMSITLTMKGACLEAITGTSIQQSECFAPERGEDSRSDRNDFRINRRE
jgi:hypothetical protein